MKNWEEYNHEEIETIADKFTNNEFVTEEELKTWYAFKRELNHTIKTFNQIQQRLDEEDKEMSSKVKDIMRKAENELSWVKSIITYDIEDFCEYYYHTSSYDEKSLETIMTEKIRNGTSTETEKNIIRELFEESNHLKAINIYRTIKTPVKLRNWQYTKRNPSEYCHYVSSMDASHLYDERTHYVYIHSKCDCHRWGESYWISVDCDNSLYSLPVIKAFKEYDFKIGGFYKIECTDVIYFGRNKKKYIMDIQESTEEEFMDKGYQQYLHCPY